MDVTELKAGLNDLKTRLEDIKEGVFEISKKESRLKEIEADLSKEEVWSDLELSQLISKEKTALEKILNSFIFFASTINKFNKAKVSNVSPDFDIIKNIK